MTDGTEASSFAVTSAHDELLLYRATPLDLSAGHALVINSTGPTLLGANTDTMPLSLPDADEVLFSNGLLYALWFEPDRVRIKTLWGDCERFGKLLSERFLNTAPGDSADIVTVASATGVDLWLDSASSSELRWSVTPAEIFEHDVVVADRPVGTLAFSHRPFVGYAEDRGVAGSHLTFVNTETNISSTHRADFAFSALGRVLIPASVDPADPTSDHGVHILGGPDASFLSTPGPVIDGGGSDLAGAIAVLTGTDVDVFRLRWDENHGIGIEILATTPGYKSISPDGSLVACRGFDDRVTVSAINGLERGTPALRDAQQFNFDVTLLTPEAVSGCVVHLHGGPEGFEVPEPRLFGLPQYCRNNGWDWIGVNYPGSIAPQTSVTRSAWMRWRSAVMEEVERAVAQARGPVVLAGWSFGAALSLACASVSPRVRGLMLGGAPGAFRQHVAEAVNIDGNHEEWFRRRFDLEGDDGVFLDGESGFNPSVRVLEFHGALDEHCPSAFADELATSWASRGNPWERVWLPGEGHYARTVEDAELIARESRAFLHGVFDQ